VTYFYLGTKGGKGSQKRVCKTLPSAEKSFLPDAQMGREMQNALLPPDNFPADIVRAGCTLVS
jgi:hypothetical protein